MNRKFSLKITSNYDNMQSHKEEHEETPIEDYTIINHPSLEFI
jgi:hypothetical protein